MQNRAGVGGPGLQVGSITREAWMGHLPREDADTEAAGVGAPLGGDTLLRAGPWGEPRDSLHPSDLGENPCWQVYPDPHHTAGSQGSESPSLARACVLIRAPQRTAFLGITLAWAWPTRLSANFRGLTPWS